jgi:putative redox protein
MHDSFVSGGLHIAAHVARPARNAIGPVPGLVLCHGFPAGVAGAATSGQTYPAFAERLASETGWIVLTFNFRGAGASEGDFSLRGWADDLRAAIEHLLATERVSGVWLAGSSTGAALAISVGASDERVRGVASLAAPSDFGDWARDGRRFLDHAREVGVVRDPAFPPDVDAWIHELREFSAMESIAKLPPRPVLLLHGSDDDVVPAEDARALADAAGGQVELRIVPGGGHRLRHDPRALAILMGWMDRQPAAPE